MQPPVSELDFFACYVQPSHHRVGQRINLDTIDREIQRLNTVQALEALAQLAFRFAKPSAQTHYDVANELDGTIAEQYRDATSRFKNEGSLLLLSPQAVQRLAVRILAQDSKAARDADFRRVAAKLLKLAVALQDQISTAEDISVEIGRVAAYYQSNTMTQATADTAGILSQRSALDPHSANWIDVDQIIASAAGMSPERTLAFGLLASISANTNVGYKWPPPIGNDFRVSYDEIISWSRLWSVDLDKARERARADVLRSDWTIGSVVAFPLLEIEDEKFLWIRPDDIERLLSPVRFRSLLESRAADVGLDRTKVGPFWGLLFERYAESIGRDAAEHQGEYLDEGDIRSEIGASNLVCDGVYIYENRGIAFDFTVAGLTLSSLTDSNEEQFWANHRDAFGHKLRQLDSTIARVRRTISADRVVTLIVSAGTLPWSNFVHNFIQMEIRELGLESLTEYPRVLSPRLISVLEYRWLFSLASDGHPDIGAIVYDWAHSSLQYAPLVNFLVVSGFSPPHPEQPFEILADIGGGHGSQPMTHTAWQPNTSE